MQIILGMCYPQSQTNTSGTVKRGDFDGRGDFDNLLKLIISIPNSCSHSSDCRLFILPCLSD